MLVEKLVQAVTCIVRCRAIVFQPVAEDHRPRLELRIIESMIRAGIDNELDWRSVGTPAGDLIGAVCCRRPIVEIPNEDKRGYSWTRRGYQTWRIERSRRPELQAA